MFEDIDLLLPILFIKFISIPHREVFLSKLTSICIRIFIVEELSYNPLSWPREKHPRQALRFQDKVLIMFRILHLGALIPCDPGHTSQRFCNQLWWTVQRILLNLAWNLGPFSYFFRIILIWLAQEWCIVCQLHSKHRIHPMRLNIFLFNWCFFLNDLHSVCYKRHCRVSNMPVLFKRRSIRRVLFNQAHH